MLPKRVFVLVVFLFILFSVIRIVSASPAGCDAYCKSCFGRGSVGNCLTGGCSFYDNWCYPGTSGYCSGFLPVQCCCNPAPSYPCYTCTCNPSQPGLDAGGKCSYQCYAATECDGRSPGEAWVASSVCNWCDSSCGYNSIGSPPCPEATCNVGGWDASSCSSPTTTTILPGPTTTTILPGPTTTTILPGPTTTTIHPDNCYTLGELRCSGLREERCQDVGGYLDWVTITPVSGTCCEQLGGAWLDGHGEDGCCGYQGENDLGTQFGNRLCVKDPNYEWITGIENGRYVGNRILYCNSGFHICYEDAPYYTVHSEDYCTNLCGYYCDPLAGNVWVSDTNIEVLNDTLKPGEQIDSKSYDKANELGCCPQAWCWNGSKCIENQEDEPWSLYVYNFTNSGYRCLSGNWEPSKLVHNWNYSIKGYCPDADSQCLVSYGANSSNNHPEAFFSDEKPQCIRDGQYILDYYCKGNEWVSRTALLATKMIETVGGGSGTQFKIFCDDYKTTLNDFSYSVLGKPVLNYLNSSCSINGKPVPCVNNFCILQDIDHGFELLGTSLNVPFFNPLWGFSRVIGVGSCNSQITHGAWDYTQCGPSAIFNPNVSIVVFSLAGVPVSTVNGWELFMGLISNPFKTLSELILTGQVHYNQIAGVQLSYDVLNSSRLLQKLFIADFAGHKVQGVFENRKWDETLHKPVYYMLIKYEGFSEDICSLVNNYTQSFGERNCQAGPGYSIVLDAADNPSYIMSHWTDLTSKFKPLQGS